MLVRKVFVELLLGELGQAFHLVLLGGVVHQDVEPAELLHRLLDAALAERLVADIARDLDGVAAFVFDQLDRFVGVLVLFKIDDRDVRALARHGDRGGAADAAVAAGDQRDLALKPARAVRFREILRQRMHLVFAAGLPGLFLRGLRHGSPCSFALARQRLLDAGHVGPGILALPGKSFRQVQHGEQVRRLLGSKFLPRKRHGNGGARPRAG